jgi:2-oxoglutarate ferredoxin oxidoreductase subunit alpha
MKHVGRFTLLVAGEAGHGVRRAGMVAADYCGERGRYAFQMDDYQSLIRGGHNFSVVTSSPHPVLSQYKSAELVVALDRRSYELHRRHVSRGGLMVYNADAVSETGSAGIGLPLSELAKSYPLPALRLGVGAVVAFLAATGATREATAEYVKRKYPRDSESNVAYALAVYDAAEPRFAARFSLESGDAPATMLTGNEAIGLGMYAGGLDIYFAYPMTPSSSILHFLAGHARDFGIAVVHPESEIAVMNMAIGAASMGVRTAVGSSGGGLALMEEAISLAGMSETPVLCVLSSRPGPSTGVPTYTAQGDLSFALNQGHGEFPRIVASPGTVEEAYSLAAELMGLAWEFQTPAILVTEKHLSESRMTVQIPSSLPEQARLKQYRSKGTYGRYALTQDGVSPLRFAPSEHLVKWTSYEHDENGISTEDPDMITRMQDKRARKGETLLRTLKRMQTVRRYGDRGPLIVTYGSTTMSVREALACGGIEAEVVQPVYLAPFPRWELEDVVNRRVVVVEQSAASQMAGLLRRELGADVAASVTQYDGRPFDPAALARQLKGVLTHG